jgi:HAD superfamily hydrolase (TIGR01549 family)
MSLRARSRYADTRNTTWLSPSGFTAAVGWNPRCVKRTVIFDVDGTLVDTNYHHALAWFRALRSRDVTVPVWHIHRAIGMGGDRLIEHVAGHAVEAAYGDELRARWKAEYERLIDEVVPLEGAHELLVATREAGFGVALASSGDPDHLEHYFDLLRARDLVDEYTTAADAPHTKPDPDLVIAAWQRAGGGEAVLIGDSTWDCLAAERVGLPTVAVRTGGFSTEELLAAGAHSVLENLTELRRNLDDLPFSAARDAADDST